MLVDTLHPLYEGRAFRWRRGEAELAINEYGASNDGEAQERWRATPFYRLQESGETLLVQKLDDAAVAQDPF
ncbi:MAG: adenylate/guanylate cyclase domain-containing protein, partial [Pseudomonadota bacterium]|nr:adenylate/guanylate cyclase domain-containing protein [Pseudomonadota bacterium]